MVRVQALTNPDWSYPSLESALNERSVAFPEGWTIERAADFVADGIIRNYTPQEWGSDGLIVRRTPSRRVPATFVVGRLASRLDLLAELAGEASRVSEDPLHEEEPVIANAMLLTSEEQDLLASLVGAVWTHYGAQAALEDGRYALVDMYVQTESGALTIASRLRELDVEGMADEYARVAVRAGSEGAAVARRQGSVFFQDRGRTVTGILIVRDCVRSSERGEMTFELVADVGIVFVLDEGVFAVSLGGPFASDLTMSRARSLESLDLVDTTADWGEDILHQLAFTRELIPLLDGSGSA